MTDKQLQKKVAAELAKMPDLFTCDVEKLKRRIWTIAKNVERASQKSAA